MGGSGAQTSGVQSEEMREVIRSFHQSCTRTVAEFDGYVANFFGDCVLAYFGWPRAHEDDAERAVRAGLALAQCMVMVHRGSGPGEALVVAGGHRHRRRRGGRRWSRKARRRSSPPWAWRRTWARAS